MEFSEVVRRRRMVRRYRPEPIPDETLRRIVERARRAPSAGFTQAQSFVVVTDPAVRRQIAALAGEEAFRAKGFEPWLSPAPALVVLCTSEQAYRERYAAADKLGPHRELSWPVPFWHIDAGCSLMLLLLAAVDEGLAAGFLALPDYAGLSALLGIPDTVQPVGIVSIGHPAPDRPSASLARGWRPVEDVIHRDRW